MIESFKCKETKKIFERQYSKKFPKDIQTIGRRKLILINIAGSINDLRIPPSNHLEKLTGDRRKQHSIRINKKWRICFVWQQDHANHVEIIDYH